MSINASFFGHLGSDPELSFTEKGIAICKFSMACNLGFGDRAKTVWTHVTVFGGQAEACNQYLGKGSAVLVSSTDVDHNASINKQGEARSYLNVTANNVTFVSTGEQQQSSGGGNRGGQNKGQRRGGKPQGGNRGGQQRQRRSRPQPQPANDDYDDDDDGEPF